MSELDVQALETNFEGWRQSRAPELTLSEAFERYSIELILRDADLSDDELSAGWLGGGGDGGIDGVYFFINRRLMLEETKIPDDALSAELHIIQAKNEKGFGETPIQKMQSFVDDLFAYSKPIDTLTYYNQEVRDAISLFRGKYQAIIGQPHTFNVVFSYSTKSDQPPNLNVEKRRDNLLQVVRDHVSAANVRFEFWGAQRLTKAFRNPPNTTLALDYVHHMTMHNDESIICMARLDKFAQFLSDDNGNIREYMLEPNVRDYQGVRNPVNRDIQEALGSAEVKEFWWLNNGITILAEKCSVGAGKVIIDVPELVNGLQTSHEIFNYYSNSHADDARMVMVRVIVPPNDQTRRRIIKATNNQTTVDALSLHATEDIHFDIEELLRLYEIYYDRRKGENRRLLRPISKIISIKYLAQTVMAVALQSPDNARARPMSVLGKEEGYKSVFDVDAKTDLFLVCALIDRQVKNYLSQRNDLTSDVKNDIQFYMDTRLVSALSQKAEPTKTEIADLADTVKDSIPDDALDTCCSEILGYYKKHGGDANAAKGAAMIASLKNSLQAKFQ